MEMIKFIHKFRTFFVGLGICLGLLFYAIEPLIFLLFVLVILFLVFIFNI
jgi:hypothetical protein